jgi:integrase
MLAAWAGKEVAMGIYKRPDSNKWWISYYHNGERVREGVSTNKKEAEKVLMQRLIAINENKHPVLQKRKNKKIKFATFSEKCITDYSKPNKKSYKCDIARLKALIPNFGDFYVTEIESSHIAEYRKLRLEQKAKNHDNPVSPATVNREVILLKSMLKKAAEWYGLNLRTITLNLAKEESRERILSRGEMGLLVANAQPHLKHVILVALNTGMRKAEIHNLEWVNVNLEHNFITITAQEAKNKKIRRIAINKSLRELLLKLNLTRNGNRYVFENPKTGKPYTDLKRGWRSALERAGINDMRFHDLRHTFASHFLMNGGDLYTLKEILGHKDITTTSRYLTITTEHKSKVMEIFAVPENESNIIELAG